MQQHKNARLQEKLT